MAEPRTGGRYEIQDGKRVRIEPATQDHPEGNAPRDSKGRRLDRPEPAPAPKPSRKKD